MALMPMDVMWRYEFWRDGCRMMAMVVCVVLRASKEPLTLKNVISFVSSMPRRPQDLTSDWWKNGFCSTCLEKAYNALPRSETEVLTDYVLRYFPERSRICQEMLIDAFIGILTGIENVRENVEGGEADGP